MNMFFSKMGTQLYDIIGSAENNTVGHVANQLFGKGYAEGGIVGDEGTKLTDYDPLGTNSLIHKTGTALTKGIGGAAEAYGKSFREQMTMGHFIHNNFGSFFKASDTGGTNSQIKPPTQGKATAATDPNDFYAKWYDGMRRFAEASEVAGRGQAQVRSR